MNAIVINVCLHILVYAPKPLTVHFIIIYYLTNEFIVISYFNYLKNLRVHNQMIIINLLSFDAPTVSTTSLLFVGVDVQDSI